MKLTDKQTAYVQHRAAGLGQERAAIEAGYAKSSAKISASRMERSPDIKAAIDAARQSTQAETYASAEDYLQAVVQGRAVPDPVRVGAARCLIQYERGRERGPVKSASPTELARRGEQDKEQELRDAWAETAAKVRERLKARAA